MHPWLGPMNWLKGMGLASLSLKKVPTPKAFLGHWLSEHRAMVAEYSGPCW